VKIVKKKALENFLDPINRKKLIWFDKLSFPIICKNSRKTDEKIAGGLEPISSEHLFTKQKSLSETDLIIIFFL
jgi:hypothetical protein